MTPDSNASSTTSRRVPEKLQMFPRLPMWAHFGWQYPSPQAKATLYHDIPCLCTSRSASCSSSSFRSSSLDWRLPHNSWVHYCHLLASRVLNWVTSWASITALFNLRYFITSTRLDISMFLLLYIYLYLYIHFKITHPYSKWPDSSGVLFWLCPSCWHLQEQMLHGFR